MQNTYRYLQYFGPSVFTFDLSELHGNPQHRRNNSEIFWNAKNISDLKSKIVQSTVFKFVGEWFPAHIWRFLLLKSLCHQIMYILIYNSTILIFIYFHMYLWVAPSNQTVASLVRTIWPWSQPEKWYTWIHHANLPISLKYYWMIISK